MMFLAIFLILSMIYYTVRAFLENDAMIKARYLAKEYMEEKKISSQEEIDKFSINTEEVKKCEKLYISSDILLTSKQVKIFKDNNVEVYIIPEYYFENEIKEVQ